MFMKGGTTILNTELAQDCWASGRLYSRGFADRRKQSLECGGGGNLLMGLGKSQNHKCVFLLVSQCCELTKIMKPKTAILLLSTTQADLGAAGSRVGDGLCGVAFTSFYF